VPEYSYPALKSHQASCASYSQQVDEVWQDSPHELICIFASIVPGKFVP